MLILLPPSEGKTRPRRGRRLDLDALSWPELGPVRRQVLASVVAAAPHDDARQLFDVPAGVLPEVRANAGLLDAPTAQAQEVYRGVLYEAFDVAGMDGAARARARRWVVVSSALFGAVRLADRIPAYRLSMAARLPGLGPLAARWRPSMAGPMTEAAGRGLVVDCRSSPYAAAWTPTGEIAQRWVRATSPRVCLAKWDTTVRRPAFIWNTSTATVRSAGAFHWAA